mgnify:FL=1
MDLNWLTKTPIAHRGLHNENAPENSLSAFKNAIDNGYNIELDVQVTKDKKLIVFHDYTLKRIFNIKKHVKNCTLSELKELKFPNTNESIPTYQEVLDLVNSKTGILCEIKGLNLKDNSIEEVANIETKQYSGNVAFHSFNFGAVKYLKQHSDRSCGQLITWQFGKLEKFFLMNYFGKLKVINNSNPNFISYDVRALNPKYKATKYLKEYVDKLPILLWTINNESKVSIAEDFKANIIFEKLPLDIVEKFKAKQN